MSIEIFCSSCKFNAEFIIIVIVEMKFEAARFSQNCVYNSISWF